MWIVFIVATIVCLVCNNVVSDIRKEKKLTEANLRSATTYIIIHVAAGILLYMVAEFGMRFYSEMDLDFWSRDKITMDGILYICVKFCGAIEAFTGFVNLVLVVAKACGAGSSAVAEKAE